MGGRAPGAAVSAGGRSAAAQHEGLQREHQHEYRYQYEQEQEQRVQVLYVPAEVDSSRTTFSDVERAGIAVSTLHRAGGAGRSGTGLRSAVSARHLP